MTQEKDQPSAANESPENGVSVNADLNMRIIQSLVWYVRDNFGPERLRSLCFEAGLPVEQLESCSGWISHEQTEIILRLIHSWTGSDSAFMDACVYRMKESYGPLRFLLWASSPGQMLDMGQKHFSSISTFSRGSFERVSGSRFLLRYHSSREESRLMCLSRQAQSQALPELWDLPRGSLKEVSCICSGDDCCEYELSVYEKSRFLPVLAGAAAGAAISAAMVILSIDSLLFSAFIWGLTPLLGAAAGYIFELRRANSHNLKVAETINQGLSQIVVENQEARQEILNLHQRLKDWNRRLEEQVAKRTEAGERLSMKLETILTEQASALRGASHDMKNPLTVILQTSEVIREQLNPDTKWMADEQKQAVHRIRILLDDMLQMETTNIDSMQFLPEPIETNVLEESLRKRLRALAGTGGLRVSVISTREVPECILADRMVLDRVIDNLLTNAVKYTEQGSIVLTLDGKPGFLTIKLSDTGRGIAEEDIGGIFQAGGSDPDRRRSNSHGIGLSVVVRLLYRVGGSLEVLSLPGEGTTFWVFFPVEPLGKPEPDQGTSLPDPVNTVVTIRRVAR